MTTPEPGYGQQAQMEDPTMVGTLRAQIEMIWPQELPVLERLDLAGSGPVLDLGCGTGEFAGRAATAWPALAITGLDLFEGHVSRARASWPVQDHPHLAFEVGDARATGREAGSIGAVTLRHVLHALPDPEAVLQEARRVLMPGGLCYTLAEDYQGLLFDVEGPGASLFVQARDPVLPSGTDLFHGRAAWRLLRQAGFVDVRVDPVVVDVTNTPREPFARMLRFWRDGYAGFLAGALGCPEADVRARFDAQIATVEDPERYAAWWLLAVSGRAPDPA